jgi:hypothetical protein
MIGGDEWLFCLAFITQTKCNHHHPTIITHHSPSYKHFIITQQLTLNTQQYAIINTQHPTPVTQHNRTPCPSQEPRMWNGSY